MSGHPVSWQAPQPMWARFGNTAAAAALAADQARPAILRFASDDFMEQVIGMLQRDPSRIDALIARPETWRTPMGAHEDLAERTALPRLAQGAIRATVARRLKSSVASTVHEEERTEQAQTRRIPLKLFQPAHQRFYLFGASLVCAVPGMPDRNVVLGGVEELKFVIRRLMPATPGSTTGELFEHAFVKDANGAHWRRANGELVAGEDTLPVFPLAYQDDEGRARTLWAGLAPVGRREEYIGARVDRSPAPSFADGQRESVTVVGTQPTRSKLARLTQFQMEVAEPWKNLIRSSHALAQSLAEGSPISGSSESPIEKRKRVYELNLQQQQNSWLILLDLADYLDEHLNDVWTAIVDQGSTAGNLTDDREVLYNALGSASLPAALRRALYATNTSAESPAVSGNLRDALRAIRAAGVRDKLEMTELNYVPATIGNSDWPSFRFVLSGVDANMANTSFAASGPLAFLDDLNPATATEVEGDPRTTATTAQQAVQQASAKLDALTALVGRALVATEERNAPPVPFALQVKNALAANVNDEGWFVARFVYMNRDCGPLHPARFSAPTQRFQLANFFDADAPARPIRITLPADTSPAGLRKFSKGTAFVMSDMLCGQIQRAKSLGLIDLIRAVLPFPLHKDLDVGEGGPCTNGSVNIGMICSLSIPIVTICALILLIIIVSLLDMIFKWLPYLIMCFPIPGLAGKKARA